MIRELGSINQGAVTTMAERFAYTAADLVEYHGVALPGSLDGSLCWAICKLAYTGNNLISVKWPSGSNEMKFEWDERASYTYV